MKSEDERNIIQRLDIIKEKLDDMEKSLGNFEKLEKTIKNWDIKLEKPGNQTF